MSVQNEKQIKGQPIMYACAGCADLGELSDQVCRHLRREGFAVAGSSCLAGIGAGLRSFIDAAKAQERVITVDGCAVGCAKKIIEKIDLLPESIILTDMGYIKGETKVTTELVNKLGQEIIALKR